MNMGVIICLVGLMLAIAAWVKTKRLGPVFGIMIASFMVMAFADTSILNRAVRTLAWGINSLISPDAGTGKSPSKASSTPSPEASSSPSPKATSSPADTATPSPAPQAPESTTNWGEVWMIVGLVAASLLVLIVAAWLAVTLIRRSQVRHREYVEKREREHAEREREAERRKEVAKAWEVATAKHDDLDAEYLSYQKDLNKIARYPLMTDLAVPLTKKAVRAMTEARNLRPESAPSEMDAVEKYREAVTSFEIALRAAVANAKREGLKNFSEKEQKDLERAQELLKMAEDSRGNPNERRGAYERAIKTLQGILGEVPKEALLEIEARAKEEGILLAIEA